jgi:two-component system chemotaxis sensor kinase CheA
MKQNQRLDEIVENLSLLLVMWDGSDQMGKSAIIEIIKECYEIQSISDLAKKTITDFETCTSSEAANIISQFIATLKTNPNPAGAIETLVKDSSDGEFGANFDLEFVSSFIEQYTLSLTEFEGQVVDQRFELKENPNKDSSSFISETKKFLHTLKGDAGAVGLIGISKVTHELEDILPQQNPAKLLDLFLEFREWVGKCLNEIKNGLPISIKANEFLRTFAKTPAVESTPPQVSAAPTKERPVNNKKSDFKVVDGPYPTMGEFEIYVEFKAEAEDHLGNIESLLLDNPSELSSEQIDTVFRGVHSVKGASSYFGLIETNKISHSLESALDEVRSGKRKFTAGLRAVVFSYIDLQKSLLKSAQEAFQSELQIEPSAEVIKFLQDLSCCDDATSSIASASVRVEQPVSIPAVDEKNQPAEVISPMTSAAKAPTPTTKNTKTQENIQVKTFVKIDTMRLDRLIDAIGEMVIYSSILIRNCRELLTGHELVLKTTHQVEKFSRSLQDIGMSMRLEPIKGLFQKMSRIVWDTGKKLTKEINCDLIGEDTELDRTVIERLADPLMHMVRNAVDHGIEMPDEREKNGKPRLGTVTLSAYQAGGSIAIQIRDDGRGLDPEKLKAKAIEKGIIQPDAILTEQQAFQLIFAPGFSTAAAVTDISGRGVGMDVVRSNIESLHGSVRIESKVGLGSTFHIEFPLTLAIMDGIETMVGGKRLIFPTLSVLEFIKPKAEMITMTIGRGETFYFRGRYLPMYRLSKLLKIKTDITTPIEGIAVVIECGSQQAAILVDEMVGSCQAVIKSLGRFFEATPGLGGCAIMPTGEVGLILDVRSLLQLAKDTYEPEINIIRSAEAMHP